MYPRFCVPTSLKMPSSATVVHQPCFNAFPPSSPSKVKSLRLNPILALDSRRLKSIGHGGSDSSALARGKNRVLNRRHMAETARAASFRSGGGSRSGEDISILEQEGFINGSAGFVAGGLESTLNRLSKWLVAGVFGAIILLRHDADSLWAAMGSVINAMLSVVLKQILNQERPVSTLRSDPGMPSSHAQSIFFTVVFAIVSVGKWFGISEVTLIISALVLAFGSYLSWLRVSQQLHTISQVVVGAFVGSAFSALWFWSWSAFVLRAFQSFLWVRIVVVLGASCCCLGFFLFVIRYWLRDER
ncbi:lipid phosphate phosphatase epsilon 2, chloroplastic-like [Rhodamnia argentea]|uniref:Lipid phosphate phosphatase epsilon 2, chloroplastic-like n=1 Tax=Rhodamnia argentea TaxID=178133 RepID=A0A8B8MWE2_9MYRT|nr:lipid phosphate phosphatase epsilon 2, chloroplastic-like [Rhodamnia argentea]